MDDTKGSLLKIEVSIQNFLKEWWIPIAVLLSLLMQLLLLSTGGTRKWSSLLRAIAWSSYNAADSVAFLAMGGMAQDAIGGNKTVYAIWAPILLLHLGAPDNISAYAVEDAQLWLRHGLQMIFHVFTALFIVINCAKGTYVSLLSACLMLAGPIKYAERTLALRYASNSTIVDSALPFYRYMLLEPNLDLPLKGTVNIHDRPSDNPSTDKSDIDMSDNFNLNHYDQISPDNPISNVDQITDQSTSVTVDHDTHELATYADQMTYHPTSSNEETAGQPDRYFYIISGERDWYSEISDAEISLNAYRGAALQTAKLVTLQDVFTCSDAEALLKSGHVLHLCFGFALFKLYLRRLCRLYMYEWREDKTRRLFLDYAGDSSSGNFFARLRKETTPPEADVLFVLDVELRFLYDRIYSKAAGTAFTRTGVLFRIFTTLLLIASAAAVIPVMHMDQHIFSKIEQYLSFVLVIVALVIEMYQIARLVLSDWTKVWLVSMHIQLLAQQSKKNPRKHRAQLISRNIYSWAVKKALFSGISLRQNYWRLRIGQHSLLDSSYFESTKYSIGGISLIHKFFPESVTKYENNHKITNRFRCRTIKDLLRLCRLLIIEQSNVNAAYSQLVSVEYLVPGRRWRTHFQRICTQVAAGGLNFTDTETFMVSWHLATLVCEVLDGSVANPIMNQQENNEFLEEMKMARLLSRYCLYLLVHKAELLPCHPDIGRQVAENTENSLCSALKTVHDTGSTQNQQTNEDNVNIASLLLQRLVMEAREINVEMLLNNFSSLLPPDIKETESEYYSRTGRVPIFSEEFSMPYTIKNGILAGKLLMLGIPDRKQRWEFIWEIWIEILACLASANKVEMHLQQLTLGGEFLTQVWVLLGHMGFGSQS